MEEDSSVYDFHAEIGGVKIQAEIQEKQEARDTYDDALSSGQQAFLLEESDESRDVFRLSVGSLPAGQKATVCLSYVTELAVEADGALRYCLPAILNPRYTPAGAQSLTTPVSGASGESVPYSLSFSAHLASPSGVAQVKSNCDLTPLEYLGDDKTQAQDVINEVKKHAGTHRCFTFGIGEGASTALIKGMARAGSGHPEFITGKDRMQPKVVQSLRFALQPAVNNIVLNWDVPAGLEVVPVSETPKVLFRGHRSILYAQPKERYEREGEQIQRAAVDYLLVKYREAVCNILSVSLQFDESAVGRASLQYSLGDEPHKTEISFKLQPDKHTGYDS
ncbi:von Willebrand factor A domain-containing protein 5A [Acipenser ruthenus]|uniref:von Willebrand factor A domain-containing protein 5A n=1 Tax=Acipenser ruthenus TaxID=7906 RepID=A0A444V7C6_ACIRT|nr:von Willebrand factor A domain-containing protein 5A [Acipenser ruthenus]